MWKKIVWLFEGYREFKHVLTLLIVMTPIFALICMSEPLVYKYIFDILANGSGTLPSGLKFMSDFTDARGFGKIEGAALILLAFAAVQLVVYIVLQCHRAWMNARLEWVYRQRAFSGTTRMGPDFFNKFRTGDLVTRMTDDVAEKLSWFACSGIFRFYEAICLVIFGVALMLTIDVKLTLFAIASLPALIIIFFKTSSMLDKKFENLQTKISNLLNLIESCFSGIRVVKAYNRQSMWRTKFTQNVPERRAAEIEAAKGMARIESLYSSIWQIGMSIVVLVGGAMVISGRVSTGDIVALMSYVFMLTFPMFDIGQFLVKGRQSAVSIQRLMEIENFPPAVKNGNHSDVDVDFHEIAFQGVSFNYDSNGRAAVQGVDFTVKKGQTVALVGKIGSGKSTIINLLTRIVDPTTGDITVDGSPLRSLPLDAYRDIIGYVPQEPILFSDTIEGNIRFGDPDINNGTIDELVRLSQLEKQMEHFPKGLQTMIGTRGLTISGGEKQRVAIARALARQPKILILDDCTSALDARTEERLWDALHDVMPDMTCFVVTHRTKTLRKADKILLFDDGNVVDRGTHDELIARSESYRDLYSRSELEEQVT